MKKEFTYILAGLLLVSLTSCDFPKFNKRTLDISLNNKNTHLVLSTNSSFKKSTNRLSLKNLPTFEETTFGILPEASVLDNEETIYLHGLRKDKNVLSYLKYTYFIKNSGSNIAEYNLQIKLTENKPSIDGYYLDSELRVMVFENNASSEEHDYRVFAKRTNVPRVDEDGNPSYQEAISVNEADSTEEHPFMGYAEEFVDSSTIANINTPSFESNAVMRYTVVLWLEGFDKDSFVNAPNGASIKIGIDINAKEAK